MRSVLVVALTLAAGPGLGQNAQEALPDVRACLEAATDDVAAEGCIGEFAQRCMTEGPAGDTTTGMTSFTLAEAGAWERIMDETLGDLTLKSRASTAEEEALGLAPPPRDELLREAQRAWTAFRDADCANEVALWGEGTMREVAGAYCRLERTASRVLELRAKRAAFEGE